MLIPVMTELFCQACKDLLESIPILVMGQKCASLDFDNQTSLISMACLDFRLS